MDTAANAGRALAQQLTIVNRKGLHARASARFVRMAECFEADIKVTRDLIRSGHLLRIEVLDHVILGRRTDGRPRDYVSLRELGYFAGA